MKIDILDTLYTHKSTEGTLVIVVPNEQGKFYASRIKELSSTEVEILDCTLWRSKQGYDTRVLAISALN